MVVTKLRVRVVGAGAAGQDGVDGALKVDFWSVQIHHLGSGGGGDRCRG